MALSHDAERRAEHAELALIQAEQKLARVHESLDERDHLMQQQLDADHVRVCRVLVIFFFFFFILFFVFVVFLFLFIVLFSFLFFLFMFFFILFCFKNAVCAMYSIFFQTTSGVFRRNFLGTNSSEFVRQVITGTGSSFPAIMATALEFQQLGTRMVAWGIASSTPCRQR